MTTYRENLIDRMIAIYGFEHSIVIDFARLCEGWEENKWNNKVLTVLVEAHEAHPILEEKEPFGSF